tara:strand:- start:87 stop:560 length:474 start_codon:yes stop_codon:yes gene_type:complete
MANKRIEMVNKILYNDTVKQRPKTVSPLITKLPIPTDSDYQRGFIIRYFARQANSPKSSIIEIEKKQYSKIRNDATYFYKTLQLNWKISGELNSKLINGVKEIGVLEANQNSINEAEKELPSISTVLNNLVQFYADGGKVTTSSEGGGTMTGGTSGY